MLDKYINAGYYKFSSNKCATLIGLGIYKFAAWITAMGTKLGVRIVGVIGSAIGGIIGGLIRLAAIGSIALTYADALI